MNENNNHYSRPPTWQEARAAYVQNGYRRFEHRFAKFDAEKGLALSWSWGAFLFNAFWFLYRKMYLEAAAVFSLHLLISLGAALLFRGNLQMTYNLLMVFVILQGFMGNWLYWRAVDRQVARAWSNYRNNPPEAMRWLRHKGGTNFWVIPVALILIFYALMASGRAAV